VFHSFPDTATEKWKDLLLHFIRFSHFNIGLFETVFPCLYLHPSVVVSGQAASNEITVVQFDRICPAVLFLLKTKSVI
jgi:hypothetical protein